MQYRPTTYEYKHFNPRTHKECDRNHNSGITRRKIISIHALTRSATKQFFFKVLTSWLFQSTHSQGVRLTSQRLDARFSFISIHALTRSATHVCLLVYQQIRNFNPRTHKECDANWQTSFHCACYFNPRTHKECDWFYP